MNVLAIVDMQHRFPAARDRELIERIESALATVSESGTYQRAVVICYDESGMHTVRFPRASTHVIWKRGDDGGDELYDARARVDSADEDVQVTIDQAGADEVRACWCRPRVVEGIVRHSIITPVLVEQVRREREH